MGRLDVALQRIYDRLGSRIIVVCQVLTCVYGYLLGSTFGFGFARIKAASTGDAVLMVGSWAVVFGICAAVASLGIRRSVRPLLSWLDGGREPTDAEDAWRAALRLPASTARWYTGTLVAAAVPFVIIIALIEPAPPAVVVLGYGVGYIVGVTAVAAVTIFTAQLVARPIVRDVERSLPHHPAPTGGVSVRLRLVVIAPALLLPPFTWGGAVAFEPGSDMSGALVALAVGLVPVALFAVPLALLLAYNTLQPLDDLLRAAERLKAGDLTTRVPELSADEHGRLAHAFNEAIQGLAERELLATENQALLEEIRASRARILVASDAERRRVERNIHDGAQQRLVALALKLRMLEERADDEDLRAAIAQAGEALKGALTELRELARGLHPSVLATDGLRPALRQLAARSTVAVSVSVPDERFPDAVESTAYFVACEALANVAKYAHASHAEVSVERQNGSLLIHIADDGVGGAHYANGSGLSGLVDRVAALNGHLSVDSPLQHGTRVTAELPLS